MSDTAYTVKQGDCLNSIAYKHGYYWKTLWDLNSELRENRTDPSVLLPGDIVNIPELREKKEDCATEAKHSFKKLGIPAKFRLVVEQNGIPVANKAYKLIIDGIEVEGQTDDKGFLEESMMPDAQKASLEIDGLNFEFALGEIDPIAEPTGVQTRLQNLGFYDGAIDGDIGPVTEQAIADFLAFVGEDSDGTLDDNARQRIIERQDREHDPIENSAEDAGEESGADADPEDDEDLQDGDEIDEDEEFAEEALEEIDDENDGEGGR
ncbi:MAG: LysM peptidoglycan-binding domain-containing protein [Gammaproteobacteria bacterium]|nr:LysM peptidoglycan-binding domain-containing protein [Gammaproteobacteria bacterium]